MSVVISFFLFFFSLYLVLFFVCSLSVPSVPWSTARQSTVFCLTAPVKGCVFTASADALTASKAAIVACRTKLMSHLFALKTARATGCLTWTWACVCVSAISPGPIARQVKSQECFFCWERGKRGKACICFPLSLMRAFCPPLLFVAGMP